MRSCGPFSGFERFDDASFEAFSRIVTVVGPEQRMQVQLPARHGGFGLRPCAPHAAMAYIAATMVSRVYLADLVTTPSALATDPLLAVALAASSITKYPAVSELATQYILEGGTPGDHKQRQLSQLYEDELAAAWRSALDCDADRARVTSACAQPSAAWMIPRPFEDDVNGWFTAAELQALARLRLGLPQRDDTDQLHLCTMCGRAKADAMGRHSLVCLGSGLRTALHNDVRDVIYDLAATALLTPNKEAMCFGISCRRTDVLLKRTGRLPIAVDVAITHLDASGSFTDAAREPAGAAEKFAERKHRKYADATSPSEGNADVQLMACVFDTMGACNKEGLQLLRFVASAWGRQFDLKPCRSVPLVFQRVSTLVNRGLARLLLATNRGLHFVASADGGDTQAPARVEPPSHHASSDVGCSTLLSIASAEATPRPATGRRRASDGEGV